MNVENCKFSGHESFAFRHTWLTKGVTECAKDPSLFRRPDALVKLGVGKNMVESIKYWCLATRLIEPHPKDRFAYQPSRIGASIFLGEDGWDPYLEDEGTLWRLHYLLATNPDVATTTYFASNEWFNPDFTSASLYEALYRYAEKRQAQVTPAMLKRDIQVFIRSYAGGASAGASLEDSLDCPLADLHLIYDELSWHTYSFACGPR